MTRSQKIRWFKRSSFKLLREKPGSRTKVPAGIADRARAELDLVDAEVEDRRPRKDTTGIGSVFVAGAINVELLPLNEPFGMGDEHAAHDE